MSFQSGKARTYSISCVNPSELSVTVIVIKYSPLASLSFGLLGFGAVSLKEIVPKSSILNNAASGPPVMA